MTSAAAEPTEVKSAYLATVATQCLTNLVDTLGLLVEHHNREQGPVEQYYGYSPFDRAYGDSSHRLILYKSMADVSWPSILAALSHVLSVTSDETLMQTILKAYQSFTQVRGVVRSLSLRSNYLRRAAVTWGCEFLATLSSPQ